MSAALSDPAAVFGVCGAALVAIGLYGLLAGPELLRRILGFNAMGSGIFLLFGGLAARGGGAPDPVPQAMVITGIVVALAGTALALALGVALARGEPGAAQETGPGQGLAQDQGGEGKAGGAGNIR